MFGIDTGAALLHTPSRQLDWRVRCQL